MFTDVIMTDIMTDRGIKPLYENMKPVLVKNFPLHWYCKSVCETKFLTRLPVRASHL